MIPYIQLFNRQIPMYSVAAVIGILFAYWYVKARGKRSSVQDIDSDLVFFYSLLGAVVGAKLLYLVINARELYADRVYLLTDLSGFLAKYFLGGFVFYGGFIGCFAAVAIVCRLRGLQGWEVVRTMLPAFPLVHAFGRLGCFCAGCCYGIPTDSALGLRFHSSQFAPNDTPLFPVQLLEAFAEFAIFGLLAAASKRQVSGQKMMGGYCVLYGLVRFADEFLRGDAYRGFWGPLSISQWLSVLCFGIGLAFWFADTTPKERAVP